MGEIGCYGMSPLSFVERGADDSSTTLVLCTDSMPSAARPRTLRELTNRDDDAVNTEERIWDLTQAINVKGVWFGCKHAIIAMRNVSQLIGTYRS